jgi:hypothetical protein
VAGEVLATLGCTKDVVHDMVDHVVNVVADHPTIVGLAGDLAGDTWRLWRRLLSLDIDASLIFVLLFVLSSSSLSSSSLSSSSSEDASGSHFGPSRRRRGSRRAIWGATPTPRTCPSSGTRWCTPGHGACGEEVGPTARSPGPAPGLPVGPAAQACGGC